MKPSCIFMITPKNHTWICKKCKRKDCNKRMQNYDASFKEPVK